MADDRLDTIESARLVRKARAFHSARGRLSAANRQLAEALHPSMAAGLSPQQRAKVEEARRLIRSVDPDLRELAGINPPLPEGAPLPPLAIGGPSVVKVPATTNVIPLRRRERV